MSLLFESGSHPSPVLSTTSSEEPSQVQESTDKPYDSKFMGDSGNSHQSDMLMAEESQLDWAWQALKHELQSDKFKQAITIGRYE